MGSMYQQWIDTTSLVDRFPVRQVGKAQIEEFDVSREGSLITLLRDGPEGYVPEGHYAKLVIGDTLMMSNTRMEFLTNFYFLDNAIGHVLIGGLGMGLLLPYLLAWKWVESITVVELEQDVIDLISPGYSGKKLKIVHGDVFTYEPPKDMRYDVIYMDIWHSMSRDFSPQKRILTRRYKKWLSELGVIAHWGSDIPAEWRTHRRSTAHLRRSGQSAMLRG